MKVNDVLRKGEDKIRVLVVRDDACYCIDCSGDCMPVWIPAKKLDGYRLDTAPAINTEMTPGQKQTAHERFTMIAPMLAFLTDDKERNRIMNRISEEHPNKRCGDICADTWCIRI